MPNELNKQLPTDPMLYEIIDSFVEPITVEELSPDETHHGWYEIILAFARLGPDNNYDGDTWREVKDNQRLKAVVDNIPQR